MYTYTAAGTGLDACLPPWTEDGGYPALFKRLRDPATREKIKAEVKIDSDKWENLYLAAGSPEKILLVGFKSEKLKPLTGKTLAEVAKMRGKDPIDTTMDLIAEDESRIGTIYFLMSEENVKKELRKPWISFGSDEASQAPEGVFLKSNPHPRAYGNFARVLGKYVRDEKVISMPGSDSSIERHCRRQISASIIADFSRKECSPMWSCSIRRRSPITPPSRNRISTRSA